MQKINVTIGIPAYNEVQNIGKLIQNIQSQKEESFIIDEIIVISDGSTDNTVTEAAKFSGVTIINDGMRKGKTLRMNEIFRLAQSEAVIILDADITLLEDAIEQLIQPFFANENIMLISGTLIPLEPRTFSGKLAFVAYYLWEAAIEMTKDAEMYHCGGPMRAFRKPFYRQFIFPAITADDVFPYFACKRMEYDFAYIKNHLGYYKLPSTLADFKKQQKRFLESETVQSTNFGRDSIGQYYTITTMTKVMALIKTFFKFPFATISYFIIWLPIKISSIVSEPKIAGTWDSVVSTK